MPKIDFNVQYNENYIARLRQMKELILQNTKVKESGHPLRRLSDDLTSECIVIATLFLASDLKYSVLNQNSDARRIGAYTYASSGSVYHLEDETGSLKVVFAKPVLKAPSSGLVLGWIGKVRADSVFECSGVVLPVEMAQSKKEASDGAILIISNPNLSHGNHERLRVLVDSCAGDISYLLILGNIIGTGDMNAGFRNLCKAMGGLHCRVGMVPGPDDPTTKLIPQQPLHSRFFKELRDKGNLVDIDLYPNPCAARLLGRELVCLSRHILDDMARYIPQDNQSIQGDPADFRIHLDEKAAGEYTPREMCTDKNVFDIMEQVVKTRHLAPNAPDTLRSAPVAKEDPFILSTCDYLISGGATEPQIASINGKHHIVLVPDFSKAGMGVFLVPSTATLETIVCEDV